MRDFISVLIPVRNEEKFIKKCLDSLLNQTVTLDTYELLIIDGQSDDKTREIVQDYCIKYKNVRLLDNPRRIAPTAMNIGIKEAKGDIIIRVDGHSFVSSNFLEMNLKALKESDATCVGGPITTIASDETAEVISLAMSSPFGVGNALFRYSEKPCYVDTLAFGAYKKEIFDEIGLFDEELIRNQDDELNYRLIKSGHKIYLTPEIQSYYYSRSSLKKLFKQYYQYGYWKVRVIQKHKKPASLRHLVPVTFISSLILPTLLSIIYTPFLYLSLFIILLYLMVSIVFSVKICRKNNFKYFLKLPLIFFILHFSYGVGFLRGIFKFYLKL